MPTHRSGKKQNPERTLVTCHPTARRPALERLLAHFGETRRDEFPSVVLYFVTASLTLIAHCVLTPGEYILFEIDLSSKESILSAG